VSEASFLGRAGGGGEMTGRVEPEVLVEALRRRWLCPCPESRFLARVPFCAMKRAEFSCSSGPLAEGSWSYDDQRQHRQDRIQ
jgi:hypothetical protein